MQKNCLCSTLASAHAKIERFPVKRTGKFCEFFPERFRKPCENGIDEKYLKK